MKKLGYIVALSLALVGCKSKQEEQAEAAVQEYLQLKAQTGGAGYKPVSFESQRMSRQLPNGRVLHGYEVVHEFLMRTTDGQNISGQGTFFVDSLGNVSDAKSK